jgi:hypothetical protein
MAETRVRIPVAVLIAPRVYGASRAMRACAQRAHAQIGGLIERFDGGARALHRYSVDAIEAIGGLREVGCPTTVPPAAISCPTSLAAGSSARNAVSA